MVGDTPRNAATTSRSAAGSRQRGGEQVSRAAAPSRAEPEVGRARRGNPRRRSRRPPQVPELRDVLDSAGHPLDPALRREMEERLGHDFSRVRIHADRDAAAVADLLGADAVTVGHDVFFRGGAYRPETADGRRLLAHELLHTVQVPDPAGALWAGRDPGALSVPHEPLEREAERGAGQPGLPEVSAHPAPGASWLRYTTATPLQQRAERLDPATLVDRLVAGVLRSLRGDPVDASGRVRLQIARLAPELRSAVLDRLRVRLPSPEYRLVQELVADTEAGAGGPVDSAGTPAPVTEPTEQDAADQAGRRADQAADADQQDRHGEDTEQERRETADDADHSRQREDDQAAGEAAQRDTEQASQDEDKAKQDEAAKKDADAGKEEQAKQDERGRQQDGEAKERAGKDKARDKKKGEQERADAGQAEQEKGKATPGAVKATEPARQGPAVGAAPVAAAPVGVGGAEPVAADRADAVAEEPEGPLARHQLVERPGRDRPRDQIPPGEEPLDVEPPEAGELDRPDEPAPPPAEAVPPPPKAEDYLPKTDIDLSGVPTADQIRLPDSGTPPAPPAPPSFPAPPEPAVRDDRPESDPLAEEERREQERDRREGGAIEAAPGQIGADAAETETGTAAEATAVEPEVEPHPAAVAAPGPAGMAAPGVEAGPAVGGPAPASARMAAAPDRLGGRAAAVAAEPEPADTEAPGGPVDQESPRSPAGTDDLTVGAGGAGAPVVGGADAAGGPEPLAGGPGDTLAGGADMAPDASLEPGGGSCGAAPEPTTEAGGGACGGAAPAAAEPEQQPEPPDVSGQEPQAALATVGQLPPAQMQQALGGVDRSAGRSVGQDRDGLQADPPTTDRPSGAPRTLHGPPESAPPVATQLSTLDKVTPQTSGGQRGPEGREVPGGPTPADLVQRPHVAGDAQGNLTDDEAQQVGNAIDGVPTSDPALHQTVGPAPRVELSGETDPALGDEQKRRLDEQSGQLLGVGREDAARPLGEGQIFPDVPRQTLRARVPAGTAGGPGGVGGAAAGPGAGGTDPVSVSTVAQQERGPQIAAGYAQGQAKMGTAQQDRQQGWADANQEHQTQLQQAVADNAAAQSAERSSAKELTTGQRAQWRQEQDTLLETNGKKAVEEHDGKRVAVLKAKTDTDADIDKRKDEDNDRITKERQQAEEKARKERERKKEESSGVLGWIKSKVKQAFDALVSLVKGIFELARKAISGIIEGFKKAVTGLIDLARKAIVDLINKLADALIAISGVLLAAFPGLRDKFRKFIEDARDAAIKKVNELADALKRGVEALLDALAAGLMKLLDVLEKAYLAAIELVRSAVMKAIDFVESAIKLLGEFAALVKDIAPDPFGWLKKLGAAAREGIRVHLWVAIKTAVKQWFNDKVESVLGLGKMIINVLVKGCFSLAKIGRMAWEALVKALPIMIISIVIEKLVSMIIPAAGAILTIIQGLIAAWGTISRIIAAFAKFFAFLKAVKTGAAAACLFAVAVAAGVVALLEFITNFLLSRLAMAARGVANRLKGIAQKIMAALKRGAKSARKAAGRAINAAKRGARAAAGALRRGAQALGRVTRRGLSKLGNLAKRGLQRVTRATRALGHRLANTRLGRYVRGIGTKLKQKYQNLKKKYQDWRARRQKARDDRNKQQPTKGERLILIVERLRPKISRVLKRGVGRRLHTALLAGMRLWYRLTALSLAGGRAFSDHARLNPEALVINGVSLTPEPILGFLRTVEEDIRQQARTLNQEREPNTRQQPDGALEIDIDPDLDITTAGETLRGIAGRPFQRNFINVQGPGGGRVSMINLNPYGHTAGLFLQRDRSAGASGTRAETAETYAASEGRIIRSGRVAETATALAEFQRSRARSHGADGNEVAMLGLLAHEVEPSRNPGTGAGQRHDRLPSAILDGE